MAFERPTLTEIIVRVLDDIESEISGVNARLRRSMEKAVGVALSGASHLLHGHVSFLEKMLMWDTAEGTYLRRWAAIFSITQLQPSLAHITYTFTATGVGSIPSGTEVSVGGVDFTVDTTTAVTAGSYTLALTAVETGTTGNVTAGDPGTLASPITNVNAAGVVASLSVAARDLETDDDLRDRFLYRVRNPPKGGGPGDYVTWAEATPTVSVAQAWEYPLYLGGGTVGVIFAKANAGNSTGEEVIPTSSEVALVLAYLRTLAPTTAYVYCYAPIADAINPVIQLPAGTADAVKNAIIASLNDLLDPENGTAPGNVVNGTSTTVLLSRIREAISQAEGEVNHVLISPVADIESEFGHLPILGDIDWQVIP